MGRLAAMLALALLALLLAPAAQAQTSVTWGQRVSADLIGGSQGGVVSTGPQGSAVGDSFDYVMGRVVGVRVSVVKPTGAGDEVTFRLTGGAGLSYALSFTAAQASIVDQGGAPLSLGQYNTADTFEIRVSVGGDVEYAVQGLTRFTSPVRPAGAVLTAGLQLLGTGTALRTALLSDKSQWCATVQCTALSQCHGVGVCTDGVCSTPLVAAGTACSDMNASTTGDVCRADGSCAGTDPCAGITCPVTDGCHPSPICSSTGQCFAGASAPDGTACDDGNPLSLMDACLDGVCLGVLPSTTTMPMSTTTPGPTSTSPPSIPCVGGCPPADQCRTNGTCNGAGLCFTGPALLDGTPCDDGSVETRDDSCQSGVCVGISKCDGVTCTASSNCHEVGVCEPSSGICSLVLRPEGASCDDGFPETVEDRCFSGVCVGRDLCLGVTCQPLSNCHTAGQCSAGFCSTPQLADGTACDDGAVVTVNDQCIGGTCTGTDVCAMLNCSARHDCEENGVCIVVNTTGVCDRPFKPNSATCDDGLLETTGDRCENGVCVGDDLCQGTVCPAEKCRNPPQCLQGQCIRGARLPDFDPCDDDDPLTDDDICFDGLCGGTDLCLLNNVACGPETCRGPGVCRNGVCHYDVLLAEGTPCDDGNVSTVGDICRLDGACRGIDLCMGVQCQPLSQCHVPGACQSADGTCTNPINPLEVPCDDGNPRTDFDVCVLGECSGVDLCLGVTCPPPAVCEQPGVCQSGNCSFLPEDDGVGCDDGDAATVDDTCQAGACVGINMCVNVTCSAIDPCHVAGVCNPRTGVCSNPTAPNGLPCSDGDAATVDDACQAGACVGINMCVNVTCAPGSDCEAEGSCDPRTGACSPNLLPQGSACDDGVPTTINDRCTDKGLCFGEDLCKGVVCTRITQCHFSGTCDFLTGLCSTPLRPDGTKCDDDDPATDFDTCNATGFCAGRDLCLEQPCAPPGECQEPPSCANGVCSYAVSPDSTPCDDGLNNTVFDECSGGTCAGQDLCASVVCVPQQCQVEVACDKFTGACVTITPVTDGAACDDARPESVNDACLGGVCLGQELCANVSCPPRSDCELNGQCDFQTGVCQPVFRADTSACDDGIARTVMDQCMGGVCAGVDLCANVTCSPLSQCHAAGVCDIQTGVCDDPLLPTNTSCNDGDAATDFDVCLANGTCAGIDLCDGFTCLPSAVCRLPGVCANGVCSFEAEDDLTECDDGNPRTVQDACQAGFCVGLDLCGNETCGPVGCLAQGVCNVQTGLCVRPLAANGTSCDDGDSTTVSDVCTDGACAGTNRCDLTQCRPASQCELGSSCFNGTCSYPPMADGVLCSDGNATTGLDTCQGGVCVGVDLCIGVVCSALDDCHAVGTCQAATGACDDPQLANGTACDDGDSITVGDVCTGGLCGGVDPCAGVLCSPPGQCQITNECRGGTCTATPRPDTLPCEDNMHETYRDLCFSGACFGIEPCTLGIFCVAWADKTAVLETAQYGLRKTSGTALWDAGARSLFPVLPESNFVGVRFSPASQATMKVGLGDNSSSNAFEDIEHGFFLASSGLLTVHEGALPALFVTASYQPGDRLEVRVSRAGPIEYLYNDAVVHTSASPFTYPRFVDVSLFDPTAAIVNVSFVEKDEAWCEDVTCNPAADCSDAAVCFEGQCQPAAPRREGLGCDDGAPQTLNDTCAAGACVGIDLCAGVTCTALSQCHGVGACDFRTGVCDDPLLFMTPCDDGNPATVGDQCIAGTCVGTDNCRNVSCPTVSQCHAPGVCSVLDGSCINTVMTNASCDDGNPITVDDRCDAAGACAGVDLCAGVDCQTGLGQCFASSACNQATGRCVSVAAAAGVACDDGLAETALDACDGAGACLGQRLCANVSCPGATACLEAAACEFATGLCVAPPKADGLVCDDGAAQTVMDQCTGGVCAGVDLCANVTCADSACRTAGVCDFQTGVCRDPPRPNGTACDDGIPASVNERCESGVCVGDFLCDGVACTALDQCHVPGMCRFGDGTCSQPAAADGLACDDGNATTDVDACSGGVCVGRVACAGVVCTPLSDCHDAGVCTLGVCSNPPKADGTPCSDGDPDTCGDECRAGSCAGAPVTCAFGAATGAVFFSNGCGGFDTAATSWTPQPSLAASPCSCITDGGVELFNADATGSSPSACANLICTGGQFFGFSECRFNGATVITGAWDPAFSVVTVPGDSQALLCSASASGMPVPCDLGAPTSAAPPSTTPTTTASTTPDSGCSLGRIATVQWGPDLVGASLTVNLGDTISWVWDGDVLLNVVSGAGGIADGLFASGAPAFQGAFAVTMRQVGRFEYFSSIQAQAIVAAIRVVDPVVAPAAPAEAAMPAATLDLNTDSLDGVTVDVGQTVRFVWSGAAPLNVVSGCPGANSSGLLFRSGAAAAAGDFAVTFTAAGTFYFFSEGDPRTGFIVVEDAGNNGGGNGGGGMACGPDSIPAARCESTDVFFLVDGSESIAPAEFAAAREFVANYSRALLARSLDTRIALAEYSTQYTMVSGFSGDPDVVAARALAMNQSFGITVSASALIAAAQVLGQSGRPRRVLIHLTDGSTSFSDRAQISTAIAVLRDLDIRSGSVGVGTNVQVGELTAFALNRADRVFLTSFAALPAFLDELVGATEALFCDTPVVPLIPCTTTAQTTPTTTGAATTSFVCGNATIPAVGCEALDLYVLVDGSESVAPGNFEDVRGFVSSVAADLAGRARFLGLALGEYSFVLHQQTAAFLESEPAFQASLQGLNQSFGITNTATALSDAADFIQREARTVRHGFAALEAQRVILFLTDGRTSPGNRAALPAALDKLAAAGITVVPVGLGPQPDVAELTAIAGNRPELVASGVAFGDLPALVGPLLDTLEQRVCAAPTVPAVPCPFASTTATTTATTSVACGPPTVPGEGCELLDLFILIDGSESVRGVDFATMLAFLGDVVSRAFGDALVDAAVALGEFSTAFTAVSGFSSDEAAVLAALGGVRQSFGITNTGTALLAAIQALNQLPSARVVRGQSLPVTKAILLMTDGRTSMGDATSFNLALSQLTQSGIEVVPVGLDGTAIDSELLALAGGNPSQRFVDLPFASLNQLFVDVLASTLAREVCSAPLLPAVPCDTTASTTVATTATTTNSPACGDSTIPADGCDLVEFYVLLDGSESVRPEDFALQLDFARNLSRALLARSLSARVSVGEYSTAFTQVTPAPLSTAAEVDALSVTQSFGITFTATAVQQAVAVLDQVASPQRFPGAGVVQPTKVLITFTDGATSLGDQGNLPAAISSLGASNIVSVAVGLENNVDVAELTSLALGRSDLVVQSGFAGLASMLASFVTTIETVACPAPQVPRVPCMEMCGADTIPTTPQCELLDIVVLADGSESIRPQDFALMQQFVSGFSSAFVPTALDGAFGLAEFSSSTTFVTPSYVSGEAAVLAAASQLTQSFGITNMATALISVANFMVANGRQGAFPGAGQLVSTKAIVLFTDGRVSRDDRGNINTAISLLRANNIRLITVGFAGATVDDSELLLLSGDSRLVFTGVGFGSIDTITGSLTSALNTIVCPAPQVPAFPCSSTPTTTQSTTGTTSPTTSPATSPTTTATSSPTTSATTTATTSPTTSATSTPTTSTMLCTPDVLPVRCEVFEIFFLIDGSESIAPFNFEVVRDFAVNVTRALHARVPSTRIGIAEYSSALNILPQSFFGSEAAAVANLANLTQSLGVTNTGTALQNVFAYFDANDRPVPPNASFTRAIILVTDGLTSNRDTANLDAALAQLNGRSGTDAFTVFGVGLDGVGTQELLQLNGNRSDRVFATPDYTALDGIVEQLTTGVADSCTPIQFDLVRCPFDPNVIDLLDPANHNGAVPGLPDGSVFFDGQGALTVTAARGVGPTFSLAFVVAQQPGTFGYLFSKGDPMGSTRFYALLSEAGSLTLFYQTAGSPAIRRASFTGRLDNGQPHRLLLTVRGTEATLLLDNRRLQARQLDGLVDDCGAPSPTCAFYVGQRGSTDNNFQRFTGTMFQAAIFYRRVLNHPFDLAVSTPPVPSTSASTTPATSPQPTVSTTASTTSSTTASTTPATTPSTTATSTPATSASASSAAPSTGTAAGAALDLLDPAVHAAPVALNADGSVTLDGTNPVEVDGFGPLNTGDFAVSATLVQAAGTSGYLVAKTTAAGRRYWGVYVRASAGTVQFYYAAPGSTQQLVVSFAVAVATGRPTQLLLSVTGTAATLRVTDAMRDVTLTATLSGGVDDCAPRGADCVLFLGQRADLGTRNFRLLGTVFSALVHATSLVQHPVALPVLMTTPGPTTAAAPAGAFDLLDLTVAQNLGVAAQGSALSFNAAAALQLATFPPAVTGSTLSLSFTVRQAPGTTGYVMSKTDGTGQSTFYAVLSTPTSGLVLEYEDLLLATGVAIADGRIHSVLLTVQGTAVSLEVDGEAHPQAALGIALQDCASPSGSCVLSVGRRPFVSVDFDGLMFEMAFVSNLARATPPLDTVVLNMLDPRNNDGAVPATTGYRRTFSGAVGLQVLSFATITSNFEASFAVRHLTAGYYFAKSTASGSRFYGLYYSASADALIFYYRSGGATTQLSVRWTMPGVNNNQEHYVVLSVAQTTASVSVDGVSLGGRALSGIVDECGAPSPNCVMFVGQRASASGGAFRLQGEINDARLWYSSA